MNNIAHILVFWIIFASVMLITHDSLANDSTHSPITAVVVAKSCMATNSCKLLSHKVIAYYFHGEHRCTTCLRIEAWGAEAIQNSFQKELNSGFLEWKVVNVDEAENEHFNKDYGLYTKSLVIVDFQDGKQIKWKNVTT